MKQAASVRWKEFKADVSAATARLRKSTERVADLAHSSLSTFRE